MNNRFNFRDYITERAFGILKLFCLMLGIFIGVFGGDTFYKILMAILVMRFVRVIVFLQILYAVIESFGSVVFLIILCRRVFPEGIRQFVSEQATLGSNAYYLPVAFSLGVFVGLAGHPLLMLLDSTFR
jgi:hypothetical protein